MQNDGGLERIVRIALAVIFPPLAVLDKGCGMTALVFFLTLTLWVPGMIVALIIVLNDERHDHRYVSIPGEAKAKRKGAYMRLADGDVAQVVDDDDAPLDIDEKRKRGNEGY